MYISASACRFTVDEQRSEQFQNEVLVTQKILQVGDFYLRTEFRKNGPLCSLKLFPTFIVEN